MSTRRTNPDRSPEIERALRHPARRRILLGLHAEGPMSPAELARSKIGRGTRVEIYSYHFKKLHHWGLVEVLDEIPGDDLIGTRYRLTDRLSQAEIDAAALKAISGVLASISEPLVKWIDRPFLEEISDFVDAAGHQS